MSVSRNIFLFSFLLLLAPSVADDHNCKCDFEKLTHHLEHKTLIYKIGAIVAILVASALGISLPILGKNLSALHPESSVFFLIKSFAAGVILCTGFIHILPDAFDNLTNPCLNESWKKFPFTGLFAMIGALGSLMIDAFATGHYHRIHFEKPPCSVAVDRETSGAHAHHGHLHTDVLHDHPHGPGVDPEPQGLSELDRIRYKVTSQVLEMGIVVHSIIIGLSLGTSESLPTIKSLMVVLCFHQFFEGVGLAGCIVQASFKWSSTLCMALFFFPHHSSGCCNWNHNNRLL